MGSYVFRLHQIVHVKLYKTTFGRCRCKCSADCTKVFCFFWFLSFVANAALSAVYCNAVVAVQLSPTVGLGYRANDVNIYIYIFIPGNGTKCKMFFLGGENIHTLQQICKVYVSKKHTKKNKSSVCKYSVFAVCFWFSSVVALWRIFILLFLGL